MAADEAAQTPRSAADVEAKAFASRHGPHPTVGEEDRGRRVADEAAQTSRHRRGTASRR